MIRYLYGYNCRVNQAVVGGDTSGRVHEGRLPKDDERSAHGDNEYHLPAWMDPVPAAFIISVLVRS